jgi:hypothetical protein
LVIEQAVGEHRLVVRPKNALKRAAWNELQISGDRSGVVDALYGKEGGLVHCDLAREAPIGQGLFRVAGVVQAHQVVPVTG